jgi:hypothetical protein
VSRTVAATTVDGPADTVALQKPRGDATSDKSETLQLCQLEVFRNLKAAAVSPAAQKGLGLILVKGASEAVELLHRTKGMNNFRKLIISLSTTKNEPSKGMQLLAKFWHPAARSAEQLVAEGYCSVVNKDGPAVEEEYQLQVQLSPSAPLAELKSMPVANVPNVRIPPTLALRLASEYTALESKVAALVAGERQTSNLEPPATDGLDEAASFPRQLQALMMLHKHRCEEITMEVLGLVLGT